MSMIALWLSLAAAAEPTSVLLITLDTVRGDYLSASGSTRVETVHLDELAARGTLFSRARAPIPLTLPSHASILTGLYPPEHGVRDNGAHRLAEDHRTLAEILSERGYQTAAFVSSFVLDERFGLAQGFEIYDDAVVRSAADLENPAAERRGDAVASSFESWLSTIDRERPFFAWVHLYDPHAPYDPPEPFRSRYADDLYAGEVAYTDAIVGRILEKVDTSRILVAVTGDHGEGLGEHGERTHALLIYNATLHVPLIFAGPGVASGKRVDALARTIDVAATLLDYLDLGTTFGTGVSLNDTTSAPRSAYSESTYALRHLGWSPLYGLETSSYRFIEAPERELYAIVADPGEIKNVLQDERAASRALFRELEELRARFDSAPAAASAPPDVDDETRRALESLGYMMTTAAPGDDALVDPKTKLDTYERIQRAQAERNFGDCERAIDTLSKIDDPIPLVFETRSQCLMSSERWSEAARELERAIALGFDTASLHLNLGVAQFRLGKLAESEKELRVALAMDPDNVTAHYRLGSVLAARTRHADAIRAFEAAVAINDDYVYAWNELGKTLARTGRNADALEAFRRATESDAAPPVAHFNLAVQLERMDRREDAALAYRKFLELSDEAGFPRERARARDALSRLAPVR